MSANKETMNTQPGSHEPLVDRALMGLDLTAEHHLANCPCCQVEREAIEKALQHFAEGQREQANRPENFWERQAAKIREAVHQPARAGRFAWGWIPAVGTVAVLLLVALQPGSRAPIGSREAGISDQEVLTEVERAMEGGTPMALEPAGLYAGRELEDVSYADSNPKKEQPRHAD